MTASIVEQLKEYAREHYTDGGWDVIVECYEDADILDLIDGCETLDSAIAAVAVIVDVYADRQADADNSAF